jgi:multiple sugar transport system ATP-binding protein
MNFIPCQLEQNGANMRVRVSNSISLPVQPQRANRYQSFVGKPVTLGLRPEHITEPRRNGQGDGSDFAVTLDVVEPLGMETMVFFTLNGTEVCGRVEPSSAADAGATMQLHANVDHMHLIDPASGAVI